MSQVNFSKEEKERAIKEIRDYFEVERDESIGDLQASLLLDFFTDLIGRAAYNKGMNDTKQYLFEKLDDLYEL